MLKDGKKKEMRKLNHKNDKKEWLQTIQQVKDNEKGGKLNTARESQIWVTLVKNRTFCLLYCSTRREIQNKINKQC